MKRTLRIASIIVTLILCISLCTINVLAEPDDIDDATVAPVPTVTDAPPVPTETEPVTAAPTEPPVTEPPTTAPPVTQAPVTEPPATAAPATDAPIYSSSGTNYSSYDSDYYSSKSSALSSPTKAPTAAVYDVDDRKVDTNTLRKKDWEKIAEKLKNADADDGDVDDFGFIKDSDDNFDNGAWMLYLGITLLSSGVIIIIVMIIFAVRKKKTLGSKHSKNDDRKNPPRGGSRSGPTRGGSRASKSQSSRQVKKRSKYDTDEVYIPRNASQRGGGRYKPRH